MIPEISIRIWEIQVAISEDQVKFYGVQSEISRKIYAVHEILHSPPRLLKSTRQWPPRARVVLLHLLFDRLALHWSHISPDFGFSLLNS